MTRIVEIGQTSQATAGDAAPQPVFASLTPMQELEMLAREINPDLPKDLSGHLLTISLSVAGQFANAIPLEDTE